MCLPSKVQSSRFSFDVIVEAVHGQEAKQVASPSWLDADKL